MIKIIVLIFLAIFMFPSIVQATSGACSYHNGVNCAAGPDYDGSVICMDGWTDSTVGYYDMTSCGYSTTTQLQQYMANLADNCSNESDYFNYFYAKVEEHKEYKGEGYDRLTDCLEKNRDYSAIAANVINYCGNAVGSDLTNAQKLAYEDTMKMCTNSQENVNSLNTDITNICTYTNSYLANDGLCYCNQGYSWNTDMSSCIPLEKQRACTYPNTYLGNDNLCYCISGYQWNDTKTACEYISIEETDIKDDKSFFSDVYPTMNSYNAILDLTRKKIISGYSDGTYKPYNPINRAEFTKLIIKAKFNEPESSFQKSCFPDVPSDKWYTGYICKAKEEGIISGYPDGLFRPDRNINIGEAQKIVSETFFDYIPPNQYGEQFEKDYWQFAKDNGFFLYDDWRFSGTYDELKRGEMAQMIYAVQQQ